MAIAHEHVAIKYIAVTQEDYAIKIWTCCNKIQRCCNKNTKILHNNANNLPSRHRR